MPRSSDYRIALRPDDAGQLDDVVVNDVTMFRAEMMDRNSMWMCCYLGDGQENHRVTFWVRSTRQGLKFYVTEGPNDPAFVYESDDDAATCFEATR